MNIKKISFSGFWLLSFFSGFIFKGITQVSYDFAIPLPPEGKVVNAISDRYFGLYSSVRTNVNYEFNAEGVYVVSLNFNSISRTLIRESSTYRVSNGWLHGVLKNDSIPCELEGEYYHFAVKNRVLLNGENSAHVLTKLNERTYMLNFEDAGHFTPSIFEFKGSELHVSHFNYEDGTHLFDVISEQRERKEGNLTSVTLLPTKNEWKRLSLEAILGESENYTKKE